MRELARPVSKGAAMSWKNRGRALRMRGSIQRALEEANPDVIVSFEASSVHFSWMLWERIISLL